MLLLVKKDEIEHAATRVLTQIQIDADAGVKAYDEYVKLRYPYLESAQKRDKEKVIDQLYKEVRQGAMSVAPSKMEQVKSRMKSKVKRVDEDSVPNIKRIMTKVGRSIPV